jgi:hypothetical protein
MIVQRPMRKSSLTIPFRRCRGLLVCGAALLLVQTGKASTSLEGQNPFQISTLDTEWGTLSADVAPDDHVAAVNSFGWENKSELVEQLQVWDFHKHTLVASKTLMRQTLPKVDDAAINPGFVRFAQSGRKIVVCECNQGRLLVLEPKTLDELQSIDLEMSSWPRVHPNASGFHSFVADVQVDERADRAAVLLAWWGLGGGELRVYDLISGKIIQKWDFQADVGKISLDPAGDMVAILFIPFPPGDRLLSLKERNLSVLNVDSGETVTKINTGYVASSVAFVGNDRFATVSANPEPRYFSKDTLKIWNARTGQLIREISSQPGGVHDTLLVSAGGQVALGYVGLDKERGHWWLGQESYLDNVYRRFRLWDLMTGQAIATSSDLPSLTGSAFALSAKGDIVLIYPVASGGPLQFYEMK